MLCTHGQPKVNSLSVLYAAPLASGAAGSLIYLSAAVTCNILPFSNILVVFLSGITIQEIKLNFVFAVTQIIVFSDRRRDVIEWMKNRSSTIVLAKFQCDRSTAIKLICAISVQWNSSIWTIRLHQWSFSQMEQNFHWNYRFQSVISMNSGNLINHWSMNWAQFKDPLCYLCLTGTVVASWSLKQAATGLSPFNDAYF